VKDEAQPEGKKDEPEIRPEQGESNGDGYD